MKNIENILENIYTYDELKEQGVGPGDIVAYAGNTFDKGIAWDHVLLRQGFPEDFDTSLCCYQDPRIPGKMHLYMLGFHWCGTTDGFRFRIPTEWEKKKFIKTCIDTLKEPIDQGFDGFPGFWGIDEYSQILYNLCRDGLINKRKANKLNKELKSLHGVDLLKHYEEHYLIRLH